MEKEVEKTEIIKEKVVNNESTDVKEVRATKPAGDFESKDREPSYRKYANKGFKKKKVCAFCADGVTCIDYKDTARLRRFITEKGKILPARQTSTCAKHQRELTTAIKRARCVALLPFKAD